jgi:hypothetical protein
VAANVTDFIAPMADGLILDGEMQKLDMNAEMADRAAPALADSSY